MCGPHSRLAFKRPCTQVPKYPGTYHFALQLTLNLTDVT